MISAKVQGEVTLTFIRGGISAKSKKPYLQVSNGRSEIFLNTAGLPIDENTFSSYDEDDEISLVVETTVGSDSVKVIEIL